MNNCIEEFVKIYRPSDNLVKPDNELLSFANQILPKEIVELWVNYGFGEYGDGLIKVVDPRDYMNSLYTWLGGTDFNKIPILVTAFGDVFYYRKLNETENDICLLDIHYRNIIVCTWNYKEFFNGYLFDEKIKQKVLRKLFYDKAVKTLGKLGYDEIYFFKPALCLGGAEDIKYLAKGNGRVHQIVLFKLGNQSN